MDTRIHKSMGIKHMQHCAGVWCWHVRLYTYFCYVNWNPYTVQSLLGFHFNHSSYFRPTKVVGTEVISKQVGNNLIWCLRVLSGIHGLETANTLTCTTNKLLCCCKRYKRRQSCSTIYAVSLEASSTEFNGIYSWVSAYRIALLS